MSLADLGAAERLKSWPCNRVPFLHCPTVFLLSIPLGNPSAEAPMREELEESTGRLMGACPDRKHKREHLQKQDQFSISRFLIRTPEQW